MLGLFGAMGEARAQGGAFGGPFPGLEIAIGVVDGSFAAAAVWTGVRSTIYVTRGERNAPWFIASAITGTFNLGVGVVAIASSRKLHLPGFVPYPEYLAIGVAHMVVGLWNLVMTTIGFINGKTSQETRTTITPVVLGGQGPSGSRWTGLGVQVANF